MSVFDNGTSFYSGKIGIGTSTPDSLLTLYAATNPSLEYSAGTGGPQWTEGIDTSNGNSFEIASSTALGTNPRFVINGVGNVGIGTTTPDTLLTVGSATPSGNVAHFENSTGSCYINPTTTSLSCSSDARLKTNVVPLTSTEGLAALLELDPVTFNWKTESATSSPHTGFIAQSVQPIFPDLISQGPDGFYAINYAGLTPYLVKAVQQIATISDAFETNLIAWLGNAENGIGDLYATVIHASTGNFSNQLCVGSTCVTPAQFQAMVAAANQSVNAPASPTPAASPSAATDTPHSTSSPHAPVIAINGNNPAIIQVGASYADLGATITGPQADLNLGIETYVNGTIESTIALDTSAAATDTIDYVVTDPQGLTSTSTRTVIAATPLRLLARAIARHRACDCHCDFSRPRNKSPGQSLVGAASDRTPSFSVCTLL